MAPDPRITAYKEQIRAAEAVFNTEVQKNACPAADVKEYHCHTLLGKGHMGHVYKVERKGLVYALKQQTKKYYRDKKQPETVIGEKKYWWAMCNPFITDLLYKAKDKENLYLIMEYTPHGDLLKKCNRGPLSEDQCRKLLCQVVMALEYIHACNLIFRDLKPQNILVFPRGRLKLADFGLCILQTAATNRFGGTCAYMAPEMILKALYNSTTDWWAFGIMMFQLLLHRHPFGDFEEPKEEIMRHILGRRLQDLNQTDLTEEAKDLLRQLLNKDYTIRITHTTKGVDEVKEHPWFKSIDFDQLIIQETFYELDAGDDYTKKETMVKYDLFHHVGEDEEDPLREDYKDY